MEEDSLNNDVWKVIIESGHLNQLKKIWTDLGYDQGSVLHRRSVVCDHVLNLLQQMVEEEEEFKSRLVGKIESYLKAGDALSKELKTNIDMECDLALTLLEMEKELKSRVQRFQQIKQERLDRFEILKKQEDDLCDALCIKQLLQPVTSIPTEEQLNTFEEYLSNKSKDRERCREIFVSTRQAIVAIMTELDIKPELEFEEQVVTGAHTFKFSKENMAALKELHQSLERRLEETKALTTELREKLSLLWERLHEPDEVRGAFVVAHVGHSARTLKALKQEIKRCDEKKRQNIKNFVVEVRQELERLWDECLYSEDQKLSFSHFYSDFFTEDLLDLHEREVERMKTFYDSNQNIFELIKQRQNLWDRAAVLEANAQDPNRLFQNRGGELLKEEKERKTISKNLPKIEAELMKHIDEYEGRIGKPFLIHGECFADFVKMQWEMLQESKEREKLARKARNQTDGVSMVGCKSAAGVKRKVGCTPIAPNVTKKVRTESSSKKAPAIGSNKTSSKRPVREMKKERKSLSRKNKVARKVFNYTNQNTKLTTPDVVQDIPDASHLATNVTSYNDFQNYLEKTGGCRSSVKPRHYLRELNATAAIPAGTPASKRVGTPLKTPLGTAMSLVGANRIGSRIPKPGVVQTPRSTKSPRSTRPLRFTPARGNLPFVI